MTVLDPRPAPGRFPFARPLRPPGQLALDAVCAAAVAVLCAYAVADGSAPAGGIDGFGSTERGRWAALVGVVLAGPLVWRRRRPLHVLVVVFGLSQVALLTGLVPRYAAIAPYLVVAFALYPVATTVPGRRSVAALVGCLAVVAVTEGLALPQAPDAPEGLVGIAFAVLLLGATWTAGRAARERREHARFTATEAARHAVVDERLRIARELHDVVAHSLSLIAVQAAVANHVAGSRPEETRAALGVIEETSRAALAELRRTVGGLRAEPGPLRPPPGLDDLAELVRTVGLPTTLDMQRPPHVTVPQPVALSAYRIVQEALTNVVRHAGPATCRIAVCADEAEIRVEVVDDGRGGRPHGTGGHGLVGMRERAQHYGGDLTAGPGPDGGFVVRARLPYRAAAVPA